MEVQELDYQNIMERIKWIREDQKLSLRKFADTLGVSKSVTDNIIYQRVEKVNDLYINLICDKFNVNREWLLDGEGEPYRLKEPTSWIEEIAEDLDPISKELLTKINRLEDQDLTLVNHIVNRFLDDEKKK